MNKSTRNIVILAGIAVFVFLAIWGAITLTQNVGKDPEVISKESAADALNDIYSGIRISEEIPAMGLDTVTISEGDTLPDISKYPVQVEKTTDSFIEIFSSPEKAGTGADAWMTDMANAFNDAGISVKGQKVSVRLRSIASGEAMDYISTGKYVPDAYTPSNELWGEMLKAKGIRIALAEKRLAGNVTGVLFTKSKNEELIKKYGSINLKNVIEAVEKKEILMGYTNPFASSTGLNFLVSALLTFDSKNPLSDTAVAAFENFQTNIPFVAYTTLQMRESAKSGALDGFILENQIYYNTPELKSDYVFTPFGVRHDSPMYEIGTLSAEKKAILREFINYCKDAKSIKKADEYGFNGIDDYKSEAVVPDGDTIIKAQALWKEKKNAGKDISAVFVADVSGSMEGESLNRLKESLIQGSSKINSNNSIGLITYSDDVQIHCPIRKFDSKQRAYFNGAVQNFEAGGNTAMFDGIAVATKMLMDEKSKNPDNKLMLFVLTDGENNKGHSLNDLQDILKTYKIPVYTVGYNADIAVLGTLSGINEAASINADKDDVVYKLINLFKAEM